MLIWGVATGVQTFATAALASFLFFRNQRLSLLYDAEDFRHSPLFFVIGASQAIRGDADDQTEPRTCRRITRA
jgi:hypothetical protein